MTFKMQSGTFIIPYDPKDRSAPCLVINTGILTIFTFYLILKLYTKQMVGHLTLASDLSPKEITVNSDSDIATRVDQFYDSFKVPFHFSFFDILQLKKY